MTRINAVLLVMLLASSLYLVQVSYESRRLFSALDRAQAQERELETDFERLQLDKRSQATPLRVERVARDKLGMRSASPAVTQYVDAPAPAASGPLTASAQGARP
ncbi:MAG TPA: cell division protein FtsL [Burkholderiaceae bacterium]|jgi:cell division protein FtsL|nr:cell division protein FtsL [Burkholderiaceae bacterium]